MSTNDFSIALNTPMSGRRAGTLHEPILNIVRRGVARMKHRRRARQDLARLLAFDGHLLGDIGISQADLLHSIGYGRLPERRHADD